jgi:hypothetical protein
VIDKNCGITDTGADEAAPAFVLFSRKKLCKMDFGVQTIFVKFPYCLILFKRNYVFITKIRYENQNG